jgi:hypothetical protein
LPFVVENEQTGQCQPAARTKGSINLVWVVLLGGVGADDSLVESIDPTLYRTGDKIRNLFVNLIEQHFMIVVKRSGD